MDEAEWLTRKKRIDTKLRSFDPAWQIIPWHDGLDTSKLACHAVTEVCGRIKSTRSLQPKPPSVRAGVNCRSPWLFGAEGCFAQTTGDVEYEDDVRDSSRSGGSAERRHLPNDQFAALYRHAATH